MSDYSKNMNLDETETSSFPKVNPAPEGSEAVVLSNNKLYRTPMEGGTSKNSVYDKIVTFSFDGAGAWTCNTSYADLIEYLDSGMKIGAYEIYLDGQTGQRAIFDSAYYEDEDEDDSDEVIFPCIYLDNMDDDNLVEFVVYELVVYEDDRVERRDKFEAYVRGSAGSNAPTLPEVSSSDDGKILKVVDGVWTAVAEE